MRCPLWRSLSKAGSRRHWSLQPNESRSSGQMRAVGLHRSDAKAPAPVRSLSPLGLFLSPVIAFVYMRRSCPFVCLFAGGLAGRVAAQVDTTARPPVRSRTRATDRPTDRPTDQTMTMTPYARSLRATHGATARARPRNRCSSGCSICINRTNSEYICGSISIWSNGAICQIPICLS